jgi:rod shape-determining protein MreC
MAFSFSRGLAAAAVAAAAIIILNIPVVNSAVKNAAYSALNPLQKNMWRAGAGVNVFFEPLFKSAALASENERLRREINGLLSQSAVVENLKKENDFLRQGLDLELGKDFELKLADIVGKNAARDILIIDKGAKDGMAAGMPVITGERALAGKVSKVYDDFSEVTLATSKDFSFDVKIGESGIDGLVKGRGGYCAAIDLVPKDRELESGQTIFTGGLGGIFPEGLLVGKIEEVRRNDVEMFQSAQIAPAFDAARSRQVFVAIGKYPLGLEKCIAKNEPEGK